MPTRSGGIAGWNTVVAVSCTARLYYAHTPAAVAVYVRWRYRTA
jgi:hypothetical protein